MFSGKRFVSGGVARNCWTLWRVTAATAFALLALAVPYRLWRDGGETPYAKPAYDFQPISLAGFPNSGVRAMNNAGAAVGAAWRNGEGIVHPFLYQNGKARELARPRNAKDCSADDINDRGDVVGEALTKDGCSIMMVIWGADGKITTVEWKNRLLYPSKINNAGTVVGEYLEPGFGGPFRAFLCSAGKVRDLGAFQAFGVNDAGDVTGMQVSYTGNKMQTEPVLYRSGKRRIVLPRLRGFEYGAAFAINNAGDCAGDVFGKEKRPQAVVWENGKARALSGKPSLALALNDAGLVVGVALRDASREAVVWDGKQEIFLNDALPRRKGWNLHAAVGVNERGQVVGTGTKDGAYCGFVMTPKKLYGAT